MSETHAYIVTYVTADGTTKTETLSGRNHFEVERQIKVEGGCVRGLEREEGRAEKVRSVGRSFGCITIVVLLVALAVAAYWYRVR